MEYALAFSWYTLGVGVGFEVAKNNNLLKSRGTLTAPLPGWIYHTHIYIYIYIYTRVFAYTVISLSIDNCIRNYRLVYAYTYQQNITSCHTPTRNTL